MSDDSTPAVPAEEDANDTTATVVEQTVQDADLAIVDNDRPADAVADELVEELNAAEKAGDLPEPEHDLPASTTAADIASDIEAAADEVAAKKKDATTPEVAEAAAALGDTEEDDALKDYKKRLRAFMRELRKLPGSWYIIQCYSGYENKVKTNLEMRAQTLEVEDSIFDVAVPVEEVIEIRDGKRKLVKRKLLPGYVLVRMDINDRSWSVVRDTPGVTSFVGNEGHPTPVKPRDVAKFLMPQESAPVAEGEDGTGDAPAVGAPKAPTPVEVDFQVDETVEILTGPLASMAATIKKIDVENGKLECFVSIFGRDTPTTLTFDQVQKSS